MQTKDILGALTMCNIYVAKNNIKLLSSDQANIQNGKYIAGRGKERREGR
jgi:hypothetical protein